MSQLSKLRQDLKSLATPKKAEASAWFFKTGPGQYGEGDEFIGVTLPEQRLVAKSYRDLPLADIDRLIQSPIHEERMTALIILVWQFNHADAAGRETIYDFYLAHTNRVNNWDLVDGSTAEIVGGYLNDKDRLKLDQLARSELLWERRIAMVATWYFIRQAQSADTFRIAGILLPDRHDLIQKAVGWMLREVGKRCGHEVLEDFLRTHYQQMGRTALRYAIEHFDETRRQAYLKGTA